MRGASGFKVGQVTVQEKKHNFGWGRGGGGEGGAATLFVQPAFRAYPDTLFWIRGQFVMKVWVLCVGNDHMGVS